MDELERNLAEEINAEKAHRRRITMEADFPEAAVTGYESIVDSMTNHPKDRHVLAAVVHSSCEVIVTFNLKAFPESALAPHGITAVHPDEFLLDQLDLYPQQVGRALARQAAETARPQLTLLQILASLERISLTDFAAEVRRRWPDIAPPSI